MIGKRFYITLIMLSLAWAIQAQYIQYGMYRFAAPRINPASLGLINYASAGALYRSQQSQPGVQLNSAYIQASYPFLRRKGTWSAIGIEASNDREGTGGIFQTNQLGVQYGFHIPLSKYKRLAIGASAHYFSRQIDISQLRTGNQFIEGLGFDPGLEQGEGFQDFNTNYLSFGTGIKYQVVDKKSLPKTYLGASFFHLNRPREDFIRQEQPLPINVVAEIGQQVMQRKYSRIYLEALVWQVQNNTTLNAGIVTWIDLQKYDNRLRGQSVNIFLKYLLEEGAMAGIQWDNQVFSLGVSYEVPLFANAAHEGAFEVGLKARQPVKAKARKKRKRKATSRRYTRPIRRSQTSEEEDELTIAKRPKEILIDQDSVQVAVLDSIAEPRDVLIVHFGFEFGDTGPIIEDEYVFDQVLDRMEQDSSLRIEIVGHTDDVGPGRFNQRLSTLRAQAIYDILFELGSDPDRMEFLGKGEDEPLVPNDTDDNRAENRRVEIVFIHPEDQ